MAPPRKPDPLDPDDARVPVCPDCAGCGILRRTGRQSDGKGYWWCPSCRERYDEPAYGTPSQRVETPSRISAAGRAALEWEPEEE